MGFPILGLWNNPQSSWRVVFYPRTNHQPCQGFNLHCSDDAAAESQDVQFRERKSWKTGKPPIFTSRNTFAQRVDLSGSQPQQCSVLLNSSPTAAGETKSPTLKSAKNQNGSPTHSFCSIHFQFISPSNHWDCSMRFIHLPSGCLTQLRTMAHL